MSTATIASRLLTLTLAAAVATLPAFGQEWNETLSGGGDAGDGLVTAQDLSTGNYTEITGEITSLLDVDMYKIFIDDPVSFSATTETSPGTLVDTWLYLFRSDGTCEYSNDENVNDSIYSTLPAGNAAGPMVNDVYYIAVAAWELVALDGLANKTCDDPRDFGPDWDRVNDGIPASGALAAWFTPGPARNTGTYRITMSGVLLPVELIALETTAWENDVALSWTTQSENGNVGFDVEMRRSEQDTFTKIGFVVGAGTSAEPTSYTFAVDDLTYGTYTFRLRQIDLDGSITYSQEIATTIGVPTAYDVSSVYPNPFGDNATFDVTVGTAQHVTAEVFDVLGRHVTTIFDGPVEANTRQPMQIWAGDVPSGFYVVRTTGERFVDSRVVSIIH